MKFFRDTATIRPMIEMAIARFGYSSEHNVDWYECSREKKETNVVVQFDDGSALMTMEGKKINEVFCGPLAPKERRAAVLAEYLTFVFQNPELVTVELEFEPELRKELMVLLPKNLRVRAPKYKLTWPIMDMSQFDPALPGGHYKSIRRAQHGFYRDHKVSIRDARTYPKEPLYTLVANWQKHRRAHDRAWHHHYENLILSSFKGATEARVFEVDECAVGLNAGWLVPNSNQFYGAIGLHDYSIPNLGLMLYLEDLVWLKSRGYREVDMGGGEAPLTEFKNKFQPVSFYETCAFSVGRRTGLVNSVSSTVQ